MNWNIVTNSQEIDHIISLSNEQPILLFKHSTRCSISATALQRLERNWNEALSGNIKPFYIDLIEHRELSNAIATAFNIEHQSPQVLIIKNGTCIYNASHLGISFANMVENLH